MSEVHDLAVAPAEFFSSWEFVVPLFDDILGFDDILSNIIL